MKKNLTLNKSCIKDCIKDCIRVAFELNATLMQS